MEEIRPHLHAIDLTTEEFLRVVYAYAEVDDSEDMLMMAFSPAEARFDTFAYDESFLAGSDQGRIFSSQGELKWRRVGNLMRVVYIGNKPPPDGLGDDLAEQENLTSESEKSELVLWGIRTDAKNEWIEQIVPHRFSYPMRKCEIPRGRLAIEVETWRDAAGQPRFSRYVGLKER